MIWNGNKRAVVIDRNSAAGKAQLLALIDGAGVLIANFRPGMLDRLGLGGSGGLRGGVERRCPFTQC